MNAAGMRNVFAAVLYLHSEPGDPLAAGFPEWAVNIYTVGLTSYMIVHITLTHNDFILPLSLPGGTNSSL